MGLYFLKSIFTALVLIGRVTPRLPTTPGGATLKDFQEKLRMVQRFIVEQQIEEQSSLVTLMDEIEGNTNDLHANCQEDAELMQMIYQSAMDELEQLYQITQALVRGQSKEEIQQTLTLRAKGLELRGLLGQADPDLHAIEELLRVVDVNKPMMGDPLHGTPLHYLAKRGQAIAAVPLLVREGGDFNFQDRWGNTPLLWAIANGLFSMADQIIRSPPLGTNFDIIGRGNTALHLALAKGYTNRTRDGAPLTVSSIDLMRLLIARCNVNAHEPGGNTPLHIACVRRDPVMIQELLRAGADRSITNSHGETPMDMLRKSDPEAHEILKSTACVYLMENRGSVEECEARF
ncbi:MAG: ankyrin repeat domain-containing protein [Chlamydiales bacterium]|nr:ankyrin repeat domain-containing protein [Chlamydiales bacterium]